MPGTPHTLPEGRAEPRTEAPCRRAWWLLAASWLPALAGLASFGAVHDGALATAPAPSVAVLPSGSTGAPAIAVSVHPSCPCTARTLDLLAGMVDARPGLAVTLLLTTPSDPGAAPLPMAEADPTRDGRFALQLDVGGALSRELGAERSGHATVTDASGRVVYTGGVLVGGAHHGAGASAVRAALSHLDALLAADTLERGPVDGCPLVMVAEEATR